MPKKLTQEEYIKKCNDAHGDTYDYSKVVYTTMHAKVEVICRVHGSFFPKACNHISANKTGCPVCAINASKGGMGKDGFIIAATEKHGTFYDYSKVIYDNSHSTVTIICPTHGKFHQKAYSHLAGKGCAKCAQAEASRRLKGVPKNYDITPINAEKFVEKFNSMNLPYTIKDISQYRHSTKPITFVCPIHGDFELLPITTMREGGGCRACSASHSKPERDVVAMFGDTETLIGSFPLDGKQIDVMSADRKFGVEVDGIYWHTERSKPMTYHIDKTVLAESMGIMLYHFYDTEIIQKPEIVGSMIQSALGKSERIYARKCVIVDVDHNEAKEFLEANHMQGGGAVGSIRYGLKYDNKLVALMTFGKPRFDKVQGWELIRFCNIIGHSVIGGASRLLKHFRKNNQGSIVSYANRRWSNGRLYEQIGFVKSHLSRPNYVYTDGCKFITRQQAQKHRLPELLGEGFNPEESEHQNMNRNNWYRIYDCGNIVFVMQ